MFAKSSAYSFGGIVTEATATECGHGTSGKVSAMRALSGARLLAAASVLALTAAVAVPYTMTMSTPAMAFECEDGGGTVLGADDGGSNTNTACGRTSKAGNGGGDDNTALGDKAFAGTEGDANENTAVGAKSRAGTEDGGDENTAIGSKAHAGSDTDTDHNTAVGHEANALGGNTTAVGDASLADDVDAAAFGADSSARGEGATALGQSSFAGGDRSISIGDSDATGENAIAIGTDASASGEDSVAIGTDATTTRDNQIVLGTTFESYSLPGLPGDVSRSFQSGPLELVTTDAAGNLASDDGETFRRIDEIEEGVAIAIALSDPDLFGSQTFAIKASGGFFEGSEALGVTVKGLLADDLFGGGEVLTVSGGAGFGFSQDTFGGRVSMQLGW